MPGRGSGRGNGFFVGLEGGEGVVQKFLYHRVGFQTDGDEVLAGNEDTQRQGVVGICFQHHRRIDDDEDVVVFQFHVGPFFSIQCGLQGVYGDAGEFVQFIQFRCIRGGAVDPGAFFQLLQRYFTEYMVFIMFVGSKHGAPPFFSTHFTIVRNGGSVNEKPRFCG